MRPFLHPGDRLLVWALGGVRAGDVVALADPREPRRVLVKRAVAVGPRGVEVAGDNPPASTDSRHFGPVPRSAVLGRAVYRYAPPARAGALRRPRRT